MNAKEIKNIGKKLNAFLKQFDDCFYRSQPRGHLKSYVRGQVSSLQRKSAEPIALLTKTPPRTLQRFLSYVHWDEQSDAAITTSNINPKGLEPHLSSGPLLKPIKYAMACFRFTSRLELK